MNDDLLDALNDVMLEHSDELDEKEGDFVADMIVKLDAGEVLTDGQIRWAESIVEKFQ